MHNISTISATGPDAFEFLQGQLTNDLKRLETEAEILSAWCSPKGRVIWFGTICNIDGGFGLSAPAEMADSIVQRLSIYRFRAKVEFTVIDDGATVDPATLIIDGCPFIGADQAEQFTPHMLNLDLLGAISMDKGCYTGQEIVARTHYKGATKRRTHRFVSEGPKAAIAAGDKLSLDGRDIGEVLNVAGNDFLAVVPSAEVDNGLTVNGAAIRHQDLAYL